MMLTMLRWAITFALLMVIGHRQFMRDWPVVRRNLPMLSAPGIAGFSLFNGLMYTALVFTSAVNTSIEQAAMPVVIFIVNFLLFSTRMTGAQVAGVTLSVIGVALTASHGDLTRLAQLDVNIGDAIMMAAVVLYGIYTACLRFRPPIHWQSLMIALAGAAAISSVPFPLVEHALGASLAPDATGWWIAVFTAVFPSLLAQVFFLWGIEMIGANRAGLFVNLVPIFGTLLSIAILGEEFHFYHALALALVLGGIWLAESSGRNHAGQERRGAIRAFDVPCCRAAYIAPMSKCRGLADWMAGCERTSSSTFSGKGASR